MAWCRQMALTGHNEFKTSTHETHSYSIATAELHRFDVFFTNMIVYMIDHSYMQFRHTNKYNTASTT